MRDKFDHSSTLRGKAATELLAGDLVSDELDELADNECWVGRAGKAHKFDNGPVQDSESERGKTDSARSVTQL